MTKKSSQPYMGDASAHVVNGIPIYKATYSGVPVYEMICKTVAVMRRRSDGWLNATQILKVAAFDKPQRTRVLEREVQKGEHEKVQGGYGKYQGTWIPIERGLALAKQYNVEHLMRPIIDYLPTAESPPLAPKHITAAPTRNPDKHKEKKAKLDSNNSNATASSSSQAQRGGASHAPRLSNVSSTAHERAEAAALAKERERGNSSAQGDIDMEDDGDALSDGSDALSNSPSAESSSSRTPSPMLGSDEPEEEEVGQKRKFRDEYDHRSTSQQQQQQQRRGGSIGGGGEDYRAAAYHNLPPENYAPERYEETILDYFISETSQIPSILINPPADFDPNVAIDDDGHTALHWACAMGRIRVVKLLLAAGADIFRVNHSEQTALMRSVMFSNNYDVRKFPELYELLHRSTLNIDKSNRTVFHHIADVALSKGKTHAARYYMEAILSRLADYPKELGDVINFQDEEGETAITLAARARTKRLVKALLDHGADPKLRNRDGKSAEDYILEDERFRSSPTLGGGGAGGVTGLGNPSAVIVDRGIVGGSSATSYTGTNGYTSQAQQPGGASSTSTVAATGFPLPPRDAPKIFLSDAAQQAAGRATTELSHLLSSLARSFDTELQAKDRDVSQANSLLNKIQLEIGETKRSLEGLKTKLGERLDQGRARLEGLERELEEKMNGQYAAGWERYQASAEGRVAAAEGDDVSEQEKDRLRASVESGAEKREGLVKEYIKLRAEMGTGEEMSKYRRLIRAAAGTAEGEGDLDEIVAGLLETLEAENAQAPAVPEGFIAPMPVPFNPAPAPAAKPAAAAAAVAPEPVAAPVAPAEAASAPPTPATALEFMPTTTSAAGPVPANMAPSEPAPAPAAAPAYVPAPEPATAAPAAPASTPVAAAPEPALAAPSHLAPAFGSQPQSSTIPAASTSS